MPIYKQQRYQHGAEAVKEARNSHKADVYEARKGCGDDGSGGRIEGHWVEVDGKSVWVPNRTLGPASNMAIVAFFSIVGIIAAYLIIYQPELILRLLGIEVG